MAWYGRVAWSVSTTREATRPGLVGEDGEGAQTAHRQPGVVARAAKVRLQQLSHDGLDAIGAVGPVEEPEDLGAVAGDDREPSGRRRPFDPGDEPAEVFDRFAGVAVVGGQTGRPGVEVAQRPAQR